jgi:hypothetical protein
MISAPPGDPLSPRAVPAQSAPDPAAEAEAGRQRLRQAVLTAAAVLRANPCTAEARMEFITGATAYISAYSRAVDNSAGEPLEWRTAADEQVKQTIRDVPENGLIDGAELARAVNAANGGPKPPKGFVPDFPSVTTVACDRYRLELRRNEADR